MNEDYNQYQQMYIMTSKENDIREWMTNYRESVDQYSTMIVPVICLQFSPFTCFQDRFKY